MSEDPVFFDPEMPFETDIADGDDYQVITDTLEIGTGPNITAGGSAVSVSGLINAIIVGPSTTTSSVSSATAVMPFVATASSLAVAVTPTFTTTSSTYSLPYPHVGGFNPSGVPPQAPHIQMQNPYHPILYPGMPGGDFYHRYQAMLPSTAFPGLQPTGPPPLW